MKILIYFFLFAITMLFSALPIALKRERREHFAIRAVASAVIYFGITFVAGYFSQYLVVSWFRLSYLINFAALVILLPLMFKITFYHSLFYCSIAYTIQHVISKVVIIVIVGIQPNLWLEYVIYILCATVIIAICYFLFIRDTKSNTIENGFYTPKKTTIVISTIAIAIVYILSSYSDTKGYSLVTTLYSIGCCILLMGIQFGSFGRRKLAEENVLITQILATEHRQHMLQKETVELINMKCHDLKHQINSLRAMTDEERREEQLKELEKLVMIYDSTIKTGSAALDIILTDKKLRCVGHDIKFTPIVTTTAVNELNESDIYSLFGNILDNAIEYLCRVEDKSKRYINLNVEQNGKLLIIHSENFCDREIQFKDGLPLTDKEDKDFHGFGMLSIKHIVNSHKGTLVVKQEDNKFSLNIIMPVGQSA